ncbi:hypothetical protein ILUMI_04614 [Ignelater luminosus]|uniref:Uncharacterized protein n=1 Tax=Ignelater luminosus TaxID=2038154 RepID=A0A8K0GKZ7_IGNLU|nr:hypothetical protein ILUMI_04614 [Ignelater luminosus]
MKVYAPVWFHVKLKPSCKKRIVTDTSSRNIRELGYLRLLNIHKQGKEDEPSLLANLSDEDLSNIEENPIIMEIAKHPCHAQIVERSIKLVTEASTAVCGETSRDGLI